MDAFDKTFVTVGITIFCIWAAVVIGVLIGVGWLVLEVVDRITK